MFLLYNVNAFLHTNFNLHMEGVCLFLKFLLFLREAYTDPSHIETTVSHQQKWITFQKYLPDLKEIY